MSTKDINTKDMCQQQLDQFNALVAKQDVEKQLIAVWTSKNNAMQQEIRNIQDSWNNKKSNKEITMSDQCITVGEDRNNACKRKNGLLQYSGDYVGCSLGWWDPARSGVNSKCYFQDSWYDAQRDQAINEIKNKYNINSNPPTLTPIDFTFNCLICSNTMDICNTKNPNDKAQCYIENISQVQNCILNADTGKNINSTTQVPITQQLPQETEIKEEEIDNTHLYLILGGGISLFLLIILLIIII